MRIISESRLRQFARVHGCEDLIEDLIQRLKECVSTNLVDLQKAFPSAEAVGYCTVINVGGNKYRLISAVHYKSGVIFIREILTHGQYSKNTWKKDCGC